MEKLVEEIEEQLNFDGDKIYELIELLEDRLYAY